MVIQVIYCRYCQSQDVIRHGLDKNGTQRYRCHCCRRTFHEQPGSAAHPEQLRERVLAAYQERCSMRGVCRIFGISRQTLVTWLKKSPSPAAPAPDASCAQAAGLP